MIFQKIFQLFLLGVVGELYMFVKVAAWIGFLPMILLAAATSMLGVVLMRMHSAVLRQQLSWAWARGEVSTPILLEGGLRWISAVLLIIPGFLTDALGLICLIPVVRRALAGRFLMRKESAQVADAVRRRPNAPRTINGDFIHEKDKP